jgi:hypothetical protein
MSPPATVVVMNTDELLALPEDGVERELIRGQLREKPMTRRNPQHSEAVMKLGYLLLQKKQSLCH